MNRFNRFKLKSPVFMKAKKQQEMNENDEDVDFGLNPLKSFFGQKDDMPYTEKNHIYYYTEVSQESCLDLNRKINDLNKELLKYSIEYDCPPPNIYLHINSPGGDLLSAFSTVDVIKNSRVPIISIVEGSAASAATIISMVCHKRYISPSSFMLIHQLSSENCGKYEELKDNFVNSTKFMNLVYNLYKKHTTMNDSDIKKILSHDLWLTSKECVSRGLVDGYWKSGITSLCVKNVFEDNTLFSSLSGTNEDEEENEETFIFDVNQEDEVVKKSNKRSKKK